MYTKFVTVRESMFLVTQEQRKVNIIIVTDNRKLITMRLDLAQGVILEHEVTHLINGWEKSYHWEIKCEPAPLTHNMSGMGSLNPKKKGT